MPDERLRVLQQEIHERVRQIQEQAGEWPCRKGCDQCCRRLAGLPRLTPPEVDLLREGIAKLPVEVQGEIERRMSELPPTAPYICPLLDRNAGACLVYEYRPIACRTYGFYVERDKGLYCGMIEAAVDRGHYAEVVWGNAESVDARLAELGSYRELGGSEF